MSAPGSARRRRARYGLLTAVLVGAVTASVVLVNVLGARLSARIDVTATGEHQLAPRTLGLLGRLADAGGDDPYEIVLAIDPRTVDRRALDRVRDVLEQFRRASERLRVTYIDTGAASGIDAYEALLGRLAERESGTLEAHRATVARAAEALEQLAASMRRASEALLEIGNAAPPSGGGEVNVGYFRHASDVMLALALQAEQVVQRARATLDRPLGPIDAPDTEGAAATLRPSLRAADQELRLLAENMLAAAEADGLTDRGREAARALATRARAWRDRAALAGESLDRLGRADLVRVAKVLQATEAALVIGPAGHGLTAVALDRLFPPGAAGEVARADLGAIAEELFATALGALAEPARPVIVFVHGEPGRGVEASGRFATIIDRLRVRGIDLFEWAAAVEAEPPSLAAVDPARPVVHVVLGVNSTSGGREPGQSGPERAARLGAAIQRIVEGGGSVLLSMNPSLLPTYGEPDPTVAVLKEFGLEADTALPLLRDQMTTQGRIVSPEHAVRAIESDHPIARAARGLPTLLPWAIPLRPLAEAEARVTPLVQIDDEAAWAESQWLGFWQAPPQQRALLADPPKRDEGRDDVDGPWLVAAAAERAGADAGRPQRLVAVGSNTWFTDDVSTAEVQFVDGRRAPAFPGNAELFEAAVYWLAGQDELIAQSPTARATPLIGPVSEGRLLALRWLLLAGLPACVLIAGALWRAARG